MNILEENQIDEPIIIETPCIITYHFPKINSISDIRVILLYVFNQTVNKSKISISFDIDYEKQNYNYVSAVPFSKMRDVLNINLDSELLNEYIHSMYDNDVIRSIKRTNSKPLIITGMTLKLFIIKQFKELPSVLFGSEEWNEEIKRLDELNLKNGRPISRFRG